MKSRKPIRRVSRKRQTCLREYMKRRKAYLLKHPYCQIFIRRYNLDEEDIIYDSGFYFLDTYARHCVPRATEIHHSKKPKSTYLNDESTWFAACREQHEWVENNKSQARLQGLLHNI